MLFSRQDETICVTIFFKDLVNHKSFFVSCEQLHVLPGGSTFKIPSFSWSQRRHLTQAARLLCHVCYCDACKCLHGLGICVWFYPNKLMMVMMKWVLNPSNCLIGRTNVTHDRQTTCRPDMELGHWVAGSMGHLGHLFSLGHRVPGSSL